MFTCAPFSLAAVELVAGFGVTYFLPCLKLIRCDASESSDCPDPTCTRTTMSVLTPFGFHMILATSFKLIQTVSPFVDGTIVVKYDDPTTNGRP